MLRKIPKAILLLIALVFTIILDGIAYGFFAACPACSSFSSFLMSNSALSASVFGSLSAIFSLTRKRK